MADLCTNSGPDRPVSPRGRVGCQLALAGLHGGVHTLQLGDHVDAGHAGPADHGRPPPPRNNPRLHVDL